ncbi:MAG: hypothetical protein ACJ8D9_20805 [Xanthobacteraceae bacterium]
MLDLALILWVVRIPLSFVALGLLILGTAAQAQDLFVELVGEEKRRIPLFLWLLMFVWAMPTHYAARLLLDTDRRFRAHVDHERSVASARCIAAMEAWVPRVLGLLPFLAVILALVRSYVNLPYLQEAGNEGVTAGIGWGLFYLGVLVVISAALFTWYMLRRRRDADVVGFRWAKTIASAAAPLFRLVSPDSRGQPGQPGEEGRALGRALLILLFVLFVAILAFGADWAAEQFPRGLAVPLVLGGWLPLLAYLSALGRRIRAPLILGLVVLLAVLTVLIGDNHSVRRIAAADGAGPDSRMALDRAVQLWMSENTCSGADCPRPIIVAAAGGASRAGFFTASVLGYLLQEGPYHNLDPNDVRKRLFAISGVSGGSVGAVMAVAALATKRDSAGHPCVQTSFRLWWGDQINNWRDCFEALTSGDFLTPVFVGLAFHDILRFGWWRDRAAILEEAWERRYHRVVTRPDDQQGSGCRGLACPFLTLRPKPGHWIPLLILNGTSEAEGNRIVTTILAPTYTPARPIDCPTAHRRDGRGSCEVLAQTRHFHDLLGNDAEPESWLAYVQRLFLADFWKKRQLRDIRLSTAAHNSARFPIISPPGSVRNQKHQIIDRIVDGGYVENYGALSALEIALAIRAVNSALAPFVLVISNDPDDPLDPEDDVVRGNAAAAEKYQEKSQKQKRRLDVDDGEWLTEFTAPITTFANTRTARGTHAVAQLRTALFTRMPQCAAHVAHVRVWPQSEEKSKRSRAVSMSWWLSTPIQRHLHQQTEDTKNENDNGATLDLAWTILDAKSDCAQAAPATTAETR